MTSEEHEQIEQDPGVGEMIVPPPPDWDGNAATFMVEHSGVAPVLIDPAQHYNTVIQMLGIEVANGRIELAQVRANVALALDALDRLHIDTWVRQVAHQPKLQDVSSGEMVQLEGPIIVPASEHEALSRFLAAVEALR